MPRWEQHQRAAHPDPVGGVDHAWARAHAELVRRVACLEVDLANQRTAIADMIEATFARYDIAHAVRNHIPARSGR